MNFDLPHPLLRGGGIVCLSNQSPLLRGGGIVCLANQSPLLRGGGIVCLANQSLLLSGGDGGGHLSIRGFILLPNLLLGN